MADLHDGKLHCSFCGAEKSAQVPLISGNEGRICEACVQLAHQVVSSWGQRRKNMQTLPRLRHPAAIKKHLDEYVIGQDKAKKVLALAVFNHYLRMMHHDKPFCQQQEHVELEKSNMLLLGPSGSGKTLMVRSLAQMLGVPFAMSDATSLTQAGYVGEDVESIVQRLLEAAAGDIQLAQWGIVYIDEIDKIAKRHGPSSSVRDISGEGVQQALLKMVEGTVLRLPKSGRRREGGEEISLDTTHVLFIVGGAFTGLEQVVNERLNIHKGIGFQATPRGAWSGDTASQSLDSLIPEDLQKYGLIPEFVGRFPVTAVLNDLVQADLIRILTQPRNALVKQYKKLFALQQAELVVTNDALEFIAHTALEHGTGARGLRAVMELALHDTMFCLSPGDGPVRCVLDAVILDEQTTSLQVNVTPVQVSKEEGELVSRAEWMS